MNKRNLQPGLGLASAIYVVFIYLLKEFHAWANERKWDQFYASLEITTPCISQSKFGGKEPSGDGAKMVCLDPGLAPDPGSCLVLSFGIRNDWSFDGAMVQRGCEVYAFDPFIGDGKSKDMQKILFHRLGLSDTNKTLVFRQVSGPVASYRAILEKINKVNSTVAYLKIDVEGSEYQFLRNVLHEDEVLLKNVKQLPIEIHLRTNSFRRDVLREAFSRLQDLGFRRNFVEMNPITAYIRKGKVVSGNYEITWVNDKFKLENN